MTDVLVRGLAEEELRLLKREAKRMHRSMNAQLQVVVEQWCERQRQGGVSR